MTNGFIETEERQALRKAVAAMAANYGQDYYLREGARRRAHRPNCGPRPANSASSG